MMMLNVRAEKKRFTALKKRFSKGNQLASVSTILARAVMQRGDDVALITPKYDVSYNRLFSYVQHVAHVFADHGVKKGDRVLLWANNSADFYGAYFAAWHLGATIVPLNTYLHEHELAGIIADAQPHLFVTTPDRVDSVPNNVLSCPIQTLTQELWDQSKGYLGDLDPVLFDTDDTAVILYTSGTTGVPKGVMLSSKNVMMNALQVIARFESINGPATHEERFFSVLPLFHVFAQNACMWMPILLGASIIIVPRIDRRAILAGLEYEPTMFFGFPALYGLLVLMKTAPLDSVKLFISGADALPDKIRAAFALVYGRNICSGYGLTEASPVIAVDGFNEDVPTNYVGNPLPGVSCQIRDDEGGVCGRNQIGTLWVSGDNVMQGYHNEPEQTASILVDGWLNTGDLAFIDDDGEIAICGRSKDLIISKGFNIYPQEVENVLLRHSAVFKAAVVGKDDSSFGQVPVAYVAIREGYSADHDALAAHCRKNLAAYKVPRTIVCKDDLPMTPTGKIDKKQLRSDA